MKIRSGFMLSQLGQQYVAVPVGSEMQNFQGMIKLNETAAKMWEFLSDTHKSQAELAAFLVERFGISAEEAAEDSQAFIAHLDDNNLLDHD